MEAELLGLAVEMSELSVEAPLLVSVDALLDVFLDLRIKDGVIRRMIDKWLKAGVLEEGVLRRSETGTPQGGVISPMLSNIFLHHVLDAWFEREAKPRLRGSCQLVRFADDFVMAFEDARSGRRMLNVLGKRLGRYGLTLHGTKTRYVDFRPERPRAHDPDTTFDFLGFTHVWGRSRRGRNVVRQITAKGRFTRALKTVHEWCKANRHRPLDEQHQHLARVIRGHCGYYGLTGNSKRLSGFRYWVIRHWRKALARRSRKGRVTWDRMKDILNRYPLPPATVVHSIYAARANLACEEPSAVIPFARVCEGRGSATTPPTRPQYQATSIAYRADRRATHAPNNRRLSTAHPVRMLVHRDLDLPTMLDHQFRETSIMCRLGAGT